MGKSTQGLMNKHNTISSRLLKWGALSGAITGILVLAGVIYAFTDSKIATPYIEKKSEKVFTEKHQPIEERDSVRMCRIEQRQDDDSRRTEIQFKVLYKLQCAKMTEMELRKFRDDAINDTTIPREMIYP